jgi:hypothetical protein
MTTSTRPTRLEVNCTTGEEIIIELTDEEIAQQQVWAAQNLERQAAEEAEAQRIADLKSSARAKLVAGESLTEEEAATIVL